MPVSGGPYLSAAFFCEKVLREADGVLSFIRNVDRWTVTGPTDAMPITNIQTNLVIIMKSGIHRGASQVTITPTDPAGNVMGGITLPTVFEGDDDRGVALVSGMGFPIREPGLYWFEIRVDGVVVSNVPLRVIYLRSASVASPTTPAGPS